MLKRTPLRVQLVVALLSLVALGLLTSGVAATTALRGYLVDRVDEQLIETSDSLQPRGAQRFGPRRGAARDALEPDSQFLVQLTRPDGTFFSANPRSVESRVRLPLPTLAQARQRVGKPFTVDSDAGSVRVVQRPFSDGSGTLSVALSLVDVRNTVNRLALITLVVSLGVLGLLGVLGYAVVRTSLKPLVDVERTAEAIAAGDLSRRVPERDPRTEVGRLARSLNSMLTQIESAFRARGESEAAARASEDRMRRFVADASHELRTPLTSIRGFAELYRQGAASSPDDIDRAMRRIEEEAARLGLLVDDLLLLARLDQQRPLERRPVELVALAADAVHDASAAWPAREVRLRVLAGDHTPVVLGDEARLRQVLGNLVSNAVTHTPDNSITTVTVGTEADEAVLEVADTGPGLAPEAAARVFERFYRADSSRTRAAGGTGLGLSIVSALVAAHGGTVAVQTAPGAGSRFRVRLPLAATRVIADEPATQQ